jgi:hypothetical protein
VLVLDKKSVFNYTSAFNSKDLETSLIKKTHKHDTDFKESEIIKYDGSSRSMMTPDF